MVRGLTHAPYPTIVLSQDPVDSARAATGFHAYEAFTNGPSLPACLPVLQTIFSTISISIHVWTCGSWWCQETIFSNQAILRGSAPVSSAATICRVEAWGWLSVSPLVKPKQNGPAHLEAVLRLQQ